jgi:hypothetical protein
VDRHRLGLIKTGVDGESLTGREYIGAAVRGDELNEPARPKTDK